MTGEECDLMLREKSCSLRGSHDFLCVKFYTACRLRRASAIGSAF